MYLFTVKPPLVYYISELGINDGESLDSTTETIIVQVSSDGAGNRISLLVRLEVQYCSDDLVRWVSVDKKVVSTSLNRYVIDE